VVLSRSCLNKFSLYDVEYALLSHPLPQFSIVFYLFQFHVTVINSFICFIFQISRKFRRKRLTTFNDVIMCIFLLFSLSATSPVTSNMLKATHSWTTPRPTSSSVPQIFYSPCRHRVTALYHRSHRKYSAGPYLLAATPTEVGLSHFIFH
jgi:hypothetical protein